MTRTPGAFQYKQETEKEVFKCTHINALRTTKLKILEEIEWQLGHFTYEELKSNKMAMRLTSLFKYKQQLRNEAIRWIKELRADTKEALDFYDKIAEKDKGEFHDEWIKYFFGIKEEDIK